MSGKPKILFLYTELAAYIVNCFEALANAGVEVHVVAFPVNPEAPFKFDFSQAKAIYYSRTDFSEYSLENLIQKEAYQAMVCSGWVDQVYVTLARKFKNRITQIVAFDTPRNGHWRTNISMLRARLSFRSAFHLAWVPGLPQSQFALGMGFKSEEIYTGFYTADFDHLSGLDWESAGSVFPKRFVYTGRYIDFKGIVELWNAFIALGSTEWELYCAGTGPLYPSRIQAKGIHHLGFVQPVDFDTFAGKGGVFVLPSYKEPWGVVVHEFASAGFPIICSTAVGSASAFVNENVNGHIVNMKNGNSELIRTMARFSSETDEKLWKMGRESRKLASSMSIDTWVNTAIEILKPNHA